MVRKMKMAFFFWAGASLLCMATIFFMSSQNAEASSKISGAITRGIFDAAPGWFSFSDIAVFLVSLEVFVRKSAHFIIFAVLGFCVAGAVWHLAGSGWRVFVISLCFCSLYAASDEFHQLFVPGRACMWQDWLLDTAGVLLGIGAAFVLRWSIRVWGRRKKSKIACGCEK